MFDPSNGHKPEKNYLDMIIYGAQQLGLEDQYIERLKGFESIPFVEYNPTEQHLEAINQRVWTMEEVENPDAFMSVMKGVVFDLTKFPSTWQGKLCRKDITLLWANRWAYANEENCKSVEALEEQQKVYLNGELQKWLQGAWGCKIVGKVDCATYEWGFEDYTF